MVELARVELNALHMLTKEKNAPYGSIMDVVGALVTPPEYWIPLEEGEAPMLVESESSGTFVYDLSDYGRELVRRVAIEAKAIETALRKESTPQSS